MFVNGQGRDEFVNPSKPISGDIYEAVINIMNVKKGKLFKDVTKIKDVTEDIMNSYGQNPKFQFLRTSSTNSISQKEENATDLTTSL